MPPEDRVLCRAEEARVLLIGEDLPRRLLIELPHQPGDEPALADRLAKGGQPDACRFHPRDQAIIVPARVPLDDLAGFIARKRSEGVEMDAKLVMLLAGTILA